jgi:hypothetical protein
MGLYARLGQVVTMETDVPAWLMLGLHLCVRGRVIEPS